ncbi:aminoglycoside phosphotransferase family protein [Rhizobium oryziradicis]|uniref:Aminoglycoside phosphotransferase n=1 Tax=Rhizobium oryziradicis TaxID=1867956 RepID=A0A1Q8ZU88_9HYPH|nr:aminoglycoside phosphotransferase family protein [Rhizobium oryziradicis]OLP45644.1 aminoglycoside phosphotransferase [Rhizobium oryziradicis]
MADDRKMVSTELVRSLIGAQFPQWADFTITPIVPGGWNNCSFRLGDTMVIRLPSAERYSAQVQKEQTFLPRLAPHLPLPIPEAIALGQASADFPHPFGIYGWIEGETAEHGKIDDPCRFAEDLAGFLAALYTLDASNGPEAGPHNFYRGGALSTYDRETRTAIATLKNKIDAKAATAIWETALSSQWRKPAVWLHGDIAAGNLLVNNGKLSAVIDFGSMGIGDPACDLAIAWTFFNDDSRRHFHAALPLDRETWQRGRGWALWKCLITLEKSDRDNDPQLQILDTIIQNELG